MELVKRAVTAAFCIIYTLFLMDWNQYTMVFYFSSLVVICLWEYHYQDRLGFLISASIYCCGVGGIYMGEMYFKIGGLLLYSFFGLEVMCGGSFQKLGKNIIGIIWIVIPILLSIYIISIDNDSRKIKTVMMFVFFSDAGAYFVGKYFAGKYFNKHKLTLISPKKTWEGVLGGIIVGLGVNMVLEETLLCLVSVLGGILGDLVESLYKREYHIKDAGNILPGHGGVLDRIDGFLYVIPFVFLLEL